MRHNKILQFFIFGCAIVFGCPQMGAVKAKPGVIQALQPDGSVVNIILRGNAFDKTAFSEDGFLLTTDEEGFYTFASFGTDGSLESTGIRELNPATRSPQTLQTLRVSGLKEKPVSTEVEAHSRAGVKFKSVGLMDTQFPSKGEQRSVVILVEFQDKKFSMDFPKEYYTRMLNEEGFSDNRSTGSARDYFVTNSSGIFQPDFDVYGPVQLPNRYSYYGKNDAFGDDAKAEEMIIEACELLDEEIDFSMYDRNDDGFIDNVYVFYAGYGEADGGGANTIWPHSFNITYYTREKFFFDGVQLDHYACSNELQFGTKQIDGIGTFCHEFSHVLGLADHYPTDYSAAFTPNSWDILDEGSYNNNSRTPPNYSSFERYALDWITPISAEPGDYELTSLGLDNQAIIITTEKENEFFLLENRQQIGFDKYIPYHGMLVWHIDYNRAAWNNNVVNNDADHQRVDLVEADNIQSYYTLTGDPFPGKKGITEFTCKTTPALIDWNGNPMEVDIYDIKENNDIVSLTIKSCDVSGVDQIANKYDNLIITGRYVQALDNTVRIYDITGREITLNGSNGVILSSGVYLATSPFGSFKFIIR